MLKLYSVLVVALVSAAACGDATGSGNDAGGNDVGPPAGIAQPSGATASGVAGMPLAAPLSVKLTDHRGKPTPGVVVVWTVVSGGGTLTPSSEKTDANGEVTAAWQLGTVAGAQIVTASTSGLPAVTFTATAAAGLPTRIDVVSGEEQLAVAGETLSKALVFKLTDQFGNAAANQPVQFATSGGPGELSASTGTSGPDGKVEVRVSAGRELKRGELLRVSASVPGAGSAITRSVDFYGRRPVLIFRRSTSSGGIAAYFRLVEFDWLARTERDLTPAFGLLGGGTLSPDGSMLAYAQYNSTTRKFDLTIMDMATGQARSVYAPEGRSVSSPRWTPDGRQIVFILDNATTASRFEVVALDLQTRVLETGFGGLPALPVFSRSGMMAYAQGFPSSDGSTQSDLFVRGVGSQQSTRVTATDLESEGPPAFLTESRLVFGCQNRVRAPGAQLTSRICAIDIDGTNRATLTLGARFETSPIVSRDGREIVFARLDSTTIFGESYANLYVMPAAGGTPVALPVNTPNDEFYPSFGIVGWNPPAPASSLLARYTDSRTSVQASPALVARGPQMLKERWRAGVSAVNPRSRAATR